MTIWSVCAQVMEAREAGLGFAPATKEHRRGNRMRKAAAFEVSLMGYCQMKMLCPQYLGA